MNRSLNSVEKSVRSVLPGPTAVFDFWRAHSTIKRRRHAEICTALSGVSADPLGAETQQRKEVG
jgi:hypothetical protein